MPQDVTPRRETRERGELPAGPEVEAVQPRDAEDGPDAEVVEWGGETARRSGWARIFGDRDEPVSLLNRQLVPVVAGLSGLALFASLVGEWQVTVLNQGGNNQVATAGVASVPGWGVAYLLGSFGLVACLALAIFGAPRSRHNARVVGFGLAAALLVMLVAATEALSRSSAVFGFFGVFEPENQPTISIGRGLHMAYAATIGIAIAIYLAGRFMPGSTGPEAADVEAPAPGTGDPRPADLGWRRPRPPAAPLYPEGPADLTVTESAPFANLPPPRESR